jgi:hypothetical protein
MFCTYKIISIIACNFIMYMPLLIFVSDEVADQLVCCIFVEKYSLRDQFIL